MLFFLTMYCVQFNSQDIETLVAIHFCGNLNCFKLSCHGNQYTSLQLQCSYKEMIFTES